MVLLVLMALLGAVLGATIRPELIAVPIAIAIAEALRAGVGVLAPAAVDNLQAPWWSQVSLGFAEDPLAGYLPLLGASGGAALISALLSMLTRPRALRQVSLTEATAVRRHVVKGQYVRTAGMVEDREVQKKAEARQKAILGL